MQSIPPLQTRKREEGRRRETPSLQFTHCSRISNVYRASLAENAAFFTHHALGAAAADGTVTVEVASCFGENRFAVHACTKEGL